MEGDVAAVFNACCAPAPLDISSNESKSNVWAQNGNYSYFLEISPIMCDLVLKRATSFLPIDRWSLESR